MQAILETPNARSEPARVPDKGDRVARVLGRAQGRRPEDARWPVLEMKRIRATSEMAKKIRDMRPWDYDRPLKEGRLDFLLDKLCRGEFRDCEWAIARCKEDGLDYRVNGKHTSIILAEIDSSVEAPWVIYAVYECKTREDVAALYATFDTPEQTKSMGDVTRAFAASNPRLSGINPKNLDAAVAGVYYANGGSNSGHKLPRSTRVEKMFGEDEAFVVWLNGVLAAGTHEHRFLARCGAVAAMYTCFKKSVRAATEFWTLVRDASGLAPNCPDRKLRDFLLVTSVGAGVNKSSKRKVDAREMMAKSISAWNGWRRGQKMEKLIYRPEMPIPTAV